MRYRATRFGGGHGDDERRFVAGRRARSRRAARGRSRETRPVWSNAKRGDGDARQPGAAARILHQPGDRQRVRHRARRAATAARATGCRTRPRAPRRRRRQRCRRLDRRRASKTPARPRAPGSRSRRCGDASADARCGSAKQWRRDGASLPGELASRERQIRSASGRSSRRRGIARSHGRRDRRGADRGVRPRRQVRERRDTRVRSRCRSSRSMSPDDHAQGGRHRHRNKSTATRVVSIIQVPGLPVFRVRIPRSSTRSTAA